MGSRSSSSSASTTAQYDNRQIYDAGGGIAGSGNVWDQSLSYLDGSNRSQNWTDNSSTSNWWQQVDSSNRSTTNWTDSSNRSTNNWDGSNRSTNTSTSTWTDNSDRSSFWDGSNRSTNNWDASNRSTNNWDASNRSTNNWDASNRSTSTWTDNSSSVVNLTDGGAFSFARDFGASQAQAASAIARAALDSGERAGANAVNAAVNAQTGAMRTVSDSTARALAFGDTVSGQAFESSRAAMGWAGDQLQTVSELALSVIGASAKNADASASSVQSAYRAAQDSASGSRTVIIVAVAAAGLLAAFTIFRK